MSKYIGDVSAYAYAVSEGYTGTEEEFAELMADYANVGQRAEDAADRAEDALEEFTTVTADAYTLPEGSSATANYDSGLLTFGIPKGDKGDGAVYVRASSDAVHIDCDSDGVVKHTRNVIISLECYKGERQITIQMLRQLPSITLKDDTTIEPIIDQNMDNITGFHYMVEEGTEIAETIANGYTQKYRITAKDGSDTYTLYENLTIVVIRDGAKGDKGDTGDKGDKGDKGDTGNTGNTPNLTIGTVTTLQPSAPATATISGTADNPVLSFGIPKGDTGEVSQAQFDAALALKADAIGNYPELAVGTAEQIDSDTVVSEDVAPYQFRQSISGASNRAYDKIVGGSLAVNQLVDFAQGSAKWKKNGDLTATWNNGVLVLNNATSDSAYLYQTFDAVLGHKHLVLCDAFSDEKARVQLYEAEDNFISFTLPNSRGHISRIFNVTQAITNRLQLRPNSTTATITCYSLMLIDLTAMFGTTIADYVYGLETATAGSGVEWLKAHFPRIFNAEYVPYNAGELVSVQASAHKMTGFNQFDEVWESGYWDSSDGTGKSSSSWQRNKNAVHCVPGAAYCFTQNGSGTLGYLSYYDASDNFISSLQLSSAVASGGYAYTAPANAYYMRFYRGASASGVPFCINISSSRNGQYEPYEAHSYPLDDSLELRGLPKLDADNNLVYDGDVYESTGKVARKYGIVDLGTLTWTYNSSAAVFYALLSPSPANIAVATTANAICSKYPIVAYNSMSDKQASVAYAYQSGVNIKDSAYTDAATFKTAMSGVYLVYELATPTTESAQPFTNPQVVDASGTEEYVTDSVVPVGHVTKYVENLKAKLESAPASPTEDGDYIVRQTDGVNEYVPLNSAPAITAKADVSELLKAFPVDTASGAIASFTDGAELPLKSLAVDIEPIQDLHGYDNPWPAGGGKNKFFISASRDAYSWSDGCGFAAIAAGDSSITFNGTASTAHAFAVSGAALTLPAGTYTVSMSVLGKIQFVLKKSGTQDVIANITDNAAQFTLTEETTMDLQFTIQSGASFSNQAIGFQIEEGSTATAYAPYSNICPISGHTQAVVTRTGVNLWDEEWKIGELDANTGAEISGNLLISKNYIPVLGGGSYYWKSPYGGIRCFYDGDKNFISTAYPTANTAFTTPSNARYMKFREPSNYGTTYNHDISINYPATDTTYHAGTVQSITIPLGQTVYGGTLDVVSGVLTVDWGLIDLGVLNWTYDSTYTRFTCSGFYAFGPYRPASNDTVALMVCDKYATRTDNNTASSAYNNIIGLSATRVLHIKDTSYNDIDAFKASLSGTYLAFKLLEPTTIQLTPNELSTLLGANNIWSDAGEVTADYRADPTLFIQRKIAEALS